LPARLADFARLPGLAVFTRDLYRASGHLSWAGSEGFSVAHTLRSLEKLQLLAPDRLVARLARDPAGPSLTLVPPRLYEGDSVKTLR
jgi:hypothetical protein